MIYDDISSGDLAQKPQTVNGFELKTFLLMLPMEPSFRFQLRLQFFSLFQFILFFSYTTRACFMWLLMHFLKSGTHLHATSCTFSAVMFIFVDFCEMIFSCSLLPIFIFFWTAAEDCVSVFVYCIMSMVDWLNCKAVYSDTGMLVRTFLCTQIAEVWMGYSRFTLLTAFGFCYCHLVLLERKCVS